MMDYKEFIERYEKLDDIGKKDVSEAFEVIKELAAKLEASDKQLEVAMEGIKSLKDGNVADGFHNYALYLLKKIEALTRIAELGEK